MTFFEWLNMNWPVVSGLVVTFGGLLGVMFRLGRYAVRVETMQTDINNIGASLKTVTALIPPVALREGQTLMTQTGCTGLRSSCTNHILTADLNATMTIIKQAIALLISHSKDIPQDARDKVLGQLVD